VAVIGRSLVHVKAVGREIAISGNQDHGRLMMNMGAVRAIAADGLHLGILQPSASELVGSW
jgi:hypothetical protein